MKSITSRWIGSLAAILLTAAPAPGATLTALSTFGGDGWLAPSEATFLQGANVQRGLTYNSQNNHLYVVDRNGGNFVRIVDGDTGALLGSLDVTGVAGGTFVVNAIDVDDAGVIYAANLTTASTSNFKVYRWANEAAAPTVAFDGPSNRTRTGDTFAVIGSGANTKFVAAGGSNAGQDFALFTTSDGLSYSVSNPTATGAATGAFRLGLDFAGPDTAVGKQTGQPLTVAPAAGGAAATYALNATGEAPLAWDAATNLLATIDINSNAVRLYDGLNLANAATTGLLDTENLTTGAVVANGNGVGDLKFGRNAGQLRLYALNTNNGIQAFAVVPEPASLAMLAIFGWAAACSRRRGG
ncbi:MAG: DUF4623 domain-containing protein [Pirellulales bacterium]|nr:DUF4623 domain-containing protein [Pirellulales bacterium]